MTQKTKPAEVESRTKSVWVKPELVAIDVQQTRNGGFLALDGPVSTGS